MKQNIYQRKDGRWEGRIYIPGSRKYRSVYAQTCEQVKKKLEKLNSAEDSINQNVSLTFRDVMQLWLNSRSGIKPTSLAIYRSKIAEHILPFFEDMPYTALKAADLERFKIAKLSAGLADSYVASMVVIIKSAAKYASQMYGCRDPFNMVNAPKIHKGSTAQLPSGEKYGIIGIWKHN